MKELKQQKFFEEMIEFQNSFHDWIFATGYR